MIRRSYTSRFRHPRNEPLLKVRIFLCYNSAMTINRVLVWATNKLKKNKIVSPTLDAEILLAFTLKKPKEFLFTHPEKKLATGQFNKFKKLISRRAKHEPVAYLTSHKSFYGLDFFVDKNVLIPRPDTEILVEETIKQLNSQFSILNSAVVDVGTGSGAVAISLAKNLPGAKIFATEISPNTLAVARKNARHHKVAVTFLRGNLLEPLLKRIMNYESRIMELIVVANLPYLVTKQWQKTQPEVKKYEPRQALDGGKDGLRYYKQLLQQIKKIATSYKLQVTNLLEIDPSQTKPISKLIHASFPAAKIQIKKDLAERDRIVVFEI